MFNLTTKICTKCGIEYPATVEYFHSQKAGKLGLRSVCRKCINIQRMQNYHRNGDEKRQKRRDQYQENPDKIKDSVHKSYRKRRENILQQKQVYYQGNKEAISDRKKQRRHDDLEAIREKDRLYYAEHAEQKRENRRRSNKKHIQKVRAANNLYYHKRRTNGGSHTQEQIDELLEWQDYKCLYCGKDIRDKYTRDHFIPVTSGGSNEITNIVMACKSCNSSKGKKHPFKWYKMREYV